MKFIYIYLIVLLFSSNAYSYECWDLKDKLEKINSIYINKINFQQQQVSVVLSFSKETYGAIEHCLANGDLSQRPSISNSLKSAQRTFPPFIESLEEYQFMIIKTIGLASYDLYKDKPLSFLGKYIWGAADESRMLAVSKRLRDDAMDSMIKIDSLLKKGK